MAVASLHMMIIDFLVQSWAVRPLAYMHTDWAGGYSTEGETRARVSYMLHSDLSARIELCFHQH
jgi:hypothetical protein